MSQEYIPDFPKGFCLFLELVTESLRMSRGIHVTSDSMQRTSNGVTNLLGHQHPQLKLDLPRTGYPARTSMLGIGVASLVEMSPWRLDLFPMKIFQMRESL